VDRRRERHAADGQVRLEAGDGERGGLVDEEDVRVRPGRFGGREVAESAALARVETTVAVFATAALVGAFTNPLAQGVDQFLRPLEGGPSRREPRCGDDDVLPGRRE
jgi:hypothetical protein